MAEQHRNLRVLMFPYLAMGHCAPFIELAKKLADRGFAIDLCSTPICLTLIKKRIPEKYSSLIKLVEFHLANVPELPPHYHTTNGLPRHLKGTLYNTLKMSGPQFRHVLEAQKPDLLIYDAEQLWPGGVAAALNIPAVKFYIGNAAAYCYFKHLFFKSKGLEFPFPSIYLQGYEREKLNDSDLAATLKEQVDRGTLSECDSIVLVDGSREIDGKYADYLFEASEIKVLPLGARFNELGGAGGGDTEETELIQWLGRRKERSTVFVSFGSEYFLTKEEMEEVAYGLEHSNANFIWVVRFPKGEGEEVVKLEDAIPRGFLERIGERGRVVEGWAPQVRILNHPSTGAIISHCGWSSILESIEFGVPIIAMPVDNLDHPLNARLMVENGVAVEVARDANGKFHRGNIAETIKNVIDEGTGENLRRKITTLGENMISRREEEMDEVVKMITHLCDKRQSKNA